MAGLEALAPACVPGRGRQRVSRCCAGGDAARAGGQGMRNLGEGIPRVSPDEADQVPLAEAQLVPLRRAVREPSPRPQLHRHPLLIRPARARRPAAHTPEFVVAAAPRQPAARRLLAAAEARVQVGPESPLIPQQRGRVARRAAGVVPAVPLVRTPAHPHRRHRRRASERPPASGAPAPLVGRF
jgi:hypothetical protein